MLFCQNTFEPLKLAVDEYNTCNSCDVQNKMMKAVFLSKYVRT